MNYFFFWKKSNSPKEKAKKKFETKCIHTNVYLFLFFCCCSIWISIWLFVCDLILNVIFLLFVCWIWYYFCMFVLDSLFFFFNIWKFYIDIEKKEIAISAMIHSSKLNKIGLFFRRMQDFKASCIASIFVEGK